MEPFDVSPGAVNPQCSQLTAPTLARQVAVSSDGRRGASFAPFSQLVFRNFTLKR